MSGSSRAAPGSDHTSRNALLTRQHAAAAAPGPLSLRRISFRSSLPRSAPATPPVAPALPGDHHGSCCQSCAFRPPAVPVLGLLIQKPACCGDPEVRSRPARTPCRRITCVEIKLQRHIPGRQDKRPRPTPYACPADAEACDERFASTLRGVHHPLVHDLKQPPAARLAQTTHDPPPAPASATLAKTRFDSAARSASLSCGCPFWIPSTSTCGSSPALRHRRSGSATSLSLKAAIPQSRIFRPTPRDAASDRSYAAAPEGDTLASLPKVVPGSPSS